MNLNDVIGQAKQQIKNSVQGTPDRIRNQGTYAQNTAAQNVSRTVRTGIDNTIGLPGRAVTNAVSGGLKSLNGALSDVLRGDVSGAIQKIGSAPGDVMANLSKSFGPIMSGQNIFNPGFGTGSGMGLLNGASPTQGNALAGALARPDPQLSFNWYADLPVITPIDGQPQMLPWYYVEEANVPFRNFNARSIFREGRNKHYASDYSVDGLRLAIYQDVSNKALAYLRAWQGAILKNTSSQELATRGGGFGRPSGYKKPIHVYLINPQRTVIADIEYVECWPQTIDSYNLNSSSSERVVNHVTFSVGDVFINLYDVSRSNLFNQASLDIGESFFNI